MMRTFDPIKTGRTALAIAAGTLISIITLVLLYSGLPFFGPVNDLTNAFLGGLIATLAWRFQPQYVERKPKLAFIPMLFAWLGAAGISISSTLVAFGLLGWMDGGMYLGMGYSLVGVWLLALLSMTEFGSSLGHGIRRLGMVAAVAMIIGIFAGPILASGVNPMQMPLTFIPYIAAGAGWLLFPIWCLLVGRHLTRHEAQQPALTMDRP